MNPDRTAGGDPRDLRIAELEAEVARLEETVRARDAEIASLREKVSELVGEKKELTRRVGMNSTNSSRPPASDGYRKPSPKSLRVKSGRRPGGQCGHEGCGIIIPHDPDEVVEHYPDRCAGCANRGRCRSEGVFSCAESRYVIEAVTTTKVVEHRAMCSSCPRDGGNAAGTFPEDVTAHAQYGRSFTSVVTLLSTYGAVSCSRISLMTRSLFGVTLSPGTVVSMTSRCADAAALQEGVIREGVMSAPVDHFDETGIRVNGRLYWVQDASNDRFTLLTVSGKRGMAGIEYNGILPCYEGTAVHDCWAPYFKFIGIRHGLCCAHLLRELNGIMDNEPGHSWPGLMSSLLVEMKTLKEAAACEGRSDLGPEALALLERRYDEVLALADAECPPPPDPAVRKRGRPRKGRERALIERLRDHKVQICLFARDFSVPFDNNQAERDLRNVKTKTKVSGCFRSDRGAADYLKVMSLLGTCAKQGINVVAALNAALRHEPVL